jgi:hypothetical protein
MLIIFSILCTVLFIICAALTIVLLRFARITFDIEDKLNDAVVTLDREVEIVSSILQRPLFYDSTEVKQVVDSIRNVRSTIISIAGNLEMVNEINESNKTENQT